MNTEPPQSSQEKPSDNNKPLMRTLGEAVRHIWECIKYDPTKSSGTADNNKGNISAAKPQPRIIEKEVKEEKAGKVILRETITREIEIKQDDKGHDY